MQALLIFDAGNFLIFIFIGVFGLRIYSRAGVGRDVPGCMRIFGALGSSAPLLTFVFLRDHCSSA